MTENPHTITVLSSTADAHSNVVISRAVRYSSYQGYGNGVGTFQFMYDEFQGEIRLQGSLSTDPGDADFFDIQPQDFLINYTSDSSVSVADTSDWLNGRLIITQPTTQSASYVIQGNYTFVRVQVNTQSGQVQRVLLCK